VTQENNKEVTKTCRLCGSGNLQQMIDLGPMPIAHRLAVRVDEETPLYPFGVSFCPGCGLPQITDPIDPKILYGEYNYCFSEWKPQPHITDEIDVIKAAIDGGAVFEVGCNDGMFLAALTEAGITDVAGVEPNPYAMAHAREHGLDVYEGMLTLDLSREIVARRGKFKAVVARQVLEHLQDIGGFFDCVDVLLDDDGYLFIDLPDFGTALKMGDVSMLWEEHVSYFTPEVITSMLAHYGYEPEEERRYNFSGGTVAVLAKRTGKAGNGDEFARSAAALTKDAWSYRGKTDEYGKALRNGIDRAREAGFRIVIYGVGCRACTLVNGLSLGPHIDFAVDDQKERQGKFMPGCSLEIRSSEVLAKDSRPTVCLLAVNNENDAKVTARVEALLGDQAMIMTLHSPADIHRELDRLPQA
jgi:SAM-dependent methyltransferase|tara:strand:+ start:1142 stop:2383 length:1242 start_codon:yes stop_codon:yes gene_type:complete